MSWVQINATSSKYTTKQEKLHLHTKANYNVAYVMALRWHEIIFNWSTPPENVCVRVKNESNI